MTIARVSITGRNFLGASISRISRRLHGRVVNMYGGHSIGGSLIGMSGQVMSRYF
ncbi:hypothetical protein IC229_27540 [Spirosoma sp. BT702]|uniref:Uncharacterized protein n=1 Tax=Spirosoma profusum TaxID=2771354 RepID=A0A926Y1S0_9BACT|nr:hypothetical protein [Spirosoma profusum]MBD2704425.1 hypothetical protein [Spirosoma profusum]